jgi:hypothetical protein
VPAPELDPWAPLDLDSVFGLFSPARFRWWISGGRALDLHLGRSWRDHDDTDVGVLRRDAGEAHSLLAGWDLHVAAAGRLRPWHGMPLDAARQENNVWCRRTPIGPWLLDLTIGDGTDRSWIYRRDASLRLPWEHAVLRTAGGVPYLAPEVALLFKSKGLRSKDHHDAEEVIPELGSQPRARLAGWLADDHPWQRLLR